MILTIASLLMASGGSYLALARNDTRELQASINRAERDIAVLKVQVEWLLRAR